jgi:hypothetical protein
MFHLKYGKDAGVVDTNTSLEQLCELENLCGHSMVLGNIIKAKQAGFRIRID